MKLVRTCLFTALFLVFSACANHVGRINGSSLALVSIGMSKDQVVKVLGAPQSAGATDSWELYRYWEDHGNWNHVYHEVVFVDGKVALYGLANNPDFRSKVEFIIKRR